MQQIKSGNFKKLFKSLKKTSLRELSPTTTFLVLLLAALLLLFLRRPDQLIHPDVWVEDGIVYIPESLSYGFWAIFRPMNGYLSLIPRLINLVSLQFPLEWYPVIGTLLGTCFNIVTFFCIVLFPTVLRARTVCALAIFLIPVDAEVYILPSYTFWFCSILLILVLLWEPERKEKRSFPLRFFVLVTSGLSSPFIVFLIPVMFLRFLIIRSRNELVIFFTAAGIALIHLLTVFMNSRPIALFKDIHDPLFLKTVLIKYFGYYLVSNLESKLALNLACLLFSYLLFLVLFFMGDRRRFDSMESASNKILLLLYLLLPLAIISSLARVTVFAVHPFLDGPRYFFLPYIIISFILVNPLILNRGFQVAGLSILLVAFLNSTSHFTRLQDSLDWGSSVKQYRLKEEAIFLVHYNGNINDLWSFKLRQGQCIGRFPKPLNLNRKC